jgi:DNA-binding response OmpR family regulator
MRDVTLYYARIPGKGRFAMPTIALLGEDRKALDDMSSSLEAEGHRIRAHQDAASALDRLEIDSFDLLIIDISPPDLDGEELIRRVREKSHIPVIILTAERDTLPSLEAPADDLIPKPFSQRVLVERVRLLLRRQGFAEDAASETISAEGKEREVPNSSATRYLTPLEQRVFSAALRRSVEVISSGTSRGKRS